MSHLFSPPYPTQNVHDTIKDFLKTQHFDWPTTWNLIDRIKQVMNTPCNTSSAPEFKFELPEEATKQNLAVLAKYDFGLRWALNAQQDSPLGPGKELKPLDIL